MSVTIIKEMSKDTINVKSNGLRNELKEIRKSIDTLTHALHIMIELQTHKHNEKNYNTNSNRFSDGKLWDTTSTHDYD